MTTAAKTIIVTENADSTFRVEYQGTLTFRGKLPLERDETAILEHCLVRYGSEGEWEPVDPHRLVTITLDRFSSVKDAAHTDHRTCTPEVCEILHAMHFDALLALPNGHVCGVSVIRPEVHPVDPIRRKQATR